MIRLRHGPFLCLLGLALAAPAHPAKAQEGKSGYYVGLSGMFVLPRDSEWTEDFLGTSLTVDLAMENGMGVLGTLGYRIESGLRGELEIGYRRLGLDELGRVGIDGQFDTLSLMTNGFYELNIRPVRPYVGGGIGVARHEVKVESLSGTTLVGGRLTDDTGATTVLAYQAMLGVGYPVSDRIDIHLGYRYFGTTTGDFGVPSVTYGTHNFEAGVRYRF